MPLISHPDIPDPVEVGESAVRVLEKSGWRRVDEGTSSAPQKRGGSSKTAREAEVTDVAESNEPQEG